MKVSTFIMIDEYMHIAKLYIEFLIIEVWY